MTGVVSPRGGRSAALLLAHDWSSSLGPPHAWPRCLQATVRTVLECRLPMLLWVGPTFLQIHNDACADILGSRGDSAIGRPAREVWREAWAFIGQSAEHVFATGEGRRFDNVLVPLELEGDVVDALWTYSVSPIYDDHGAIGGVLLVLNETPADRAGADAVVDVRLDEVETMGGARDELLALLGHELRNPLSPIVTAITLMKMRGDQHPKEREIIERQVAHLTRLVDDLLDVSLIARGRVDLSHGRVRVAAVIDAALETVGSLLRTQHHTVLVEVPDLLRIDGDAARLAQVFANIIGNAAKYTPPGGHIEIIAEQRGDRVIVRISDDGAGIPRAVLPRVFEMFVQGHQGTGRTQGGLGLGLALAKKLVTLHHGDVTAANRPGGGAEITVELPGLAGAHASVAPAAAPTMPSTSKTARRILVVDDNQDHVELIAAFLARVGHTVEIAYDGDTALEKLTDFDAEVALLDIGLPGMDGFELARRIRHDAPQVKRAIAVTGYGQPRDRQATKEAGFDHHLTKPVDLEQLARIIDE